MKIEENYNFIDVMKFIMSIAVITIHIQIVNTINVVIIRDFLMTIIYSSVPFFFVTSGYFLYKKYNKSNHYDNTANLTVTIKYLKRIFQLYFLWFVLYIPSRFSNMNFTIDWDTIYSIIKSFVLQGGGILWYLWGLMFAISIIFILLKFRISPFNIFLLSIGLFLFNRVYTHFASIENINGIWKPFAFIYKHHLFNVYGVCGAMAYVSMGLIIAQNKIKINNTWLYFTLVVGVFLTFFEKHKDVSLGLLPISFALFLLIKNLKVSGSPIFFKWLRNLSTLIYFLHIYIILIYDSLFNFGGLSHYLYIVLITILFSIILLYLGRYKFFKFLDYLI